MNWRKMIDDCGSLAQAWTQQVVGESTITETAWKQAYDLALSSFMLYQIEWQSKPITNWKWPFAQLETAEPFKSDIQAGEREISWTRLFRQAWLLAHPPSAPPDESRTCLLAAAKAALPELVDECEQRKHSGIAEYYAGIENIAKQLGDAIRQAEHPQAPGGLYLYRVLECDDDLDPLDHGAVRADSREELAGMLAERFASLREWDDATVLVRLYPIHDTTSGVLEDAGENFDLDVPLLPQAVSDAEMEASRCKCLDQRAPYCPVHEPA